MNAADDRLLEYLESEGPKPPSKVVESDKIDYSITHINKRLRFLQKAGLAEALGNGVYRITPKGTAYLAGDEDLRDEPKPE